MRSDDLLRANHFHGLFLSMRFNDTKFRPSQAFLVIVIAFHDTVAASDEDLVQLRVPYGFDDVRFGDFKVRDRFEGFRVEKPQSTHILVPLQGFSREHHGVVRTEAAVCLLVSEIKIEVIIYVKKKFWIEKSRLSFNNTSSTQNWVY